MIAALSKMVTLRTDVIKTAHPLRIPMPRAVTLCSLKKKKNNVVFSVIQPSEKNIWIKNWNDNTNFTILVHYLKYTTKEIIFHFFLKRTLILFQYVYKYCTCAHSEFLPGVGTDGEFLFLPYVGLTLCILDNFTMNLRNLIAWGVKPV